VSSKRKPMTPLLTPSSGLRGCILQEKKMVAVQHTPPQRLKTRCKTEMCMAKASLPVPQISFGQDALDLVCDPSVWRWSRPQNALVSMYLWRDFRSWCSLKSSDCHQRIQQVGSLLNVILIVESQRERLSLIFETKQPLSALLASDMIWIHDQN
jgi:hypothetical protein